MYYSNFAPWFLFLLSRLLDHCPFFRSLRKVYGNIFEESENRETPPPRNFYSSPFLELIYNSRVEGESWNLLDALRIFHSNRSYGDLDIYYIIRIIINHFILFPRNVTRASFLPNCARFFVFFFGRENDIQFSDPIKIRSLFNFIHRRLNLSSVTLDVCRVAERRSTR